MFLYIYNIILFFKSSLGNSFRQIKPWLGFVVKNVHTFQHIYVNFGTKSEVKKLNST